MQRHPSGLRSEARALRTLGLSLSQIAGEVGVAPSTVRRWTLDLVLPEQVLSQIDTRRREAALAASLATAESRRTQRRQWQEEGRERARTGDSLHQAGCMLYWAEGTKSRNSVLLSNSDVYLVRFFRVFLTSCLDVMPESLTLRLHLYTGNGLSVERVEEHWLEALELPRSCLRAHSINKRPIRAKGLRPNKLPYGVGNLGVLRSTWLIQHMYGAIQEYGGFDELRWLG